ncbi:MAG: YeeE/YedE thiosulfate transporter family protein [Bacteroidota bacterium]
MKDLLFGPWPWYVAGPLIALTMFFLIFFGKEFGVSGNLRTICTMSGAGKAADFFKIDWKKQSWNLVFVLGAVLGGFIAARFLTTSEQIALNPTTIDHLHSIGFTEAGSQFLPTQIFGLEAVGSLRGFLILVIGGFMVGFGARYAGGCTSGHAISGLSNLQLPSLISVVGFFIGGLLTVHFILPFLF